MKIAFDTVLKGLDGLPILDTEQDSEAPEGEKKPMATPLALRTAAVRALMVVLPTDREMKGEKKAKIWKLAMAVHGGSDEITAEDAVLLKDRIGQAYGPLVVGQAFEIIEASGK
jgi:hypothetical protein